VDEVGGDILAERLWVSTRFRGKSIGDGCTYRVERAVFRVRVELVRHPICVNVSPVHIQRASLIALLR
jgi:hypothetical protein